ncbi:hypothetical protein [Desulfogranum japonicum]|uniref:hypothetical protein n=1 Tax=Desulfogranum japonicum TaxID=231447 RepID=UPI00048D4E18|nr:hypothetical protein [Desulfogranum japonicum]
MHNFIVSISVGAVAGIIDIIPMIIQKLDRFSICSAFIHWIILGVVITYIQLPMSPWLKGLVVAEMLALPVAVLVMKDDPKSIIPIFVMSAILGVAVGVATSWFIY